VVLGRVIREHGDDRISLASLAHVVRDLRTSCHERTRRVWTSVVNRHLVAGFNQVAGHAGAHVSESDEAHFHLITP